MSEEEQEVVVEWGNPLGYATALIGGFVVGFGLPIAIVALWIWRTM